MKPKHFGWLVLLATQSVWLSGCATPAVWRAGSFDRYCEPARPPNLSLFDSSSPKDLLVEYSEMREETSSSVRRVYWLFENARRIQERRKPKFVPEAAAKGLVAIPVLQAPAAPDRSLAGGRYAIVSTNDYAFTLYSEGKEEGAFELPVYADSSGRMRQILLTPPAVVADAAIVGGIAGLACLPWLWTGLNDWVH
jgi:hypothetical protein